MGPSATQYGQAVDAAFQEGPEEQEETQRQATLQAPEVGPVQGVTGPGYQLRLQPPARTDERDFRAPIPERVCQRQSGNQVPGRAPGCDYHPQSL